MADLGNLGDLLAGLGENVKDGEKLLGELKKTAEAVFAVLDSLGFGIIEGTTAREADGSWRVNGKLYPASESTFGERLTDERVKNGDLPDWFPFAELVQSGLAFSAWKATDNPKLAQAKYLDPEFLASMLIDFVLAGATLEELEQLAPVDGSYGLGGDVQSDPALLRQWYAALFLLAAINSGANVTAFNETFGKLMGELESWNQGEKAPYTKCRPVSSSHLRLGEEGAPSAGSPGCTGVVFDPVDRSISSVYDEQGRWVTPWKGDFAKRAKSMIQFLRTGEVMQMSTAGNAGAFASFSDCVLSGDETCLSSFPLSASVWQRLMEPWREGYKSDETIQIVENRFGRFLAWNFGGKSGKPRGISLNVALAISAPLVMGLATIAATAWYLKTK